MKIFFSNILDMKKELFLSLKMKLKTTLNLTSCHLFYYYDWWKIYGMCSKHESGLLQSYA